MKSRPSRNLHTVLATAVKSSQKKVLMNHVVRHCKIALVSIKNIFSYNSPELLGYNVEGIDKLSSVENSFHMVETCGKKARR